MNAHERYKQIEQRVGAEDAGIILALCGIREAIEDGFAKLDQTQCEGAMMLVGCKESLDGFLEERLQGNKVLAGVVAAVHATEPEKQEEPAAPVDEPKKSAVTLDVGNFGLVPSDSGIA